MGRRDKIPNLVLVDERRRADGVGSVSNRPNLAVWGLVAPAHFDRNRYGCRAVIKIIQTTQALLPARLRHAFRWLMLVQVFWDPVAPAGGLPCQVFRADPRSSSIANGSAAPCRESSDAWNGA